MYQFCFFFFQAEDGIRDYKVTGVQTCALPISQAGSGVNWLMVGGMIPVWTTRAQTPASKAPAAPSKWPVIDLVEPKMSFLARSPNTAFTAAVSAASPCGVEVPWALM